MTATADPVGRRNGRQLVSYDYTLCSAPHARTFDLLQDKRTLKIGLDLGLNVGKKMNENKTVGVGQVTKKEVEKAFTVSK